MGTIAARQAVQATVVSMPKEPEYLVCWIPERYMWEAKRSDLPSVAADGDSPSQALAALQDAIGDSEPHA